ncbi:PP2C family protein-serine/threonine phosphatase [Actinocorallia sp. A-T 12471]|uniref:PP2C family protein-serine/threonine phosphatase n=1 Tax=Actinocorallia sp. A-T 12471 TaxID=3089813 RepID=UPI0029D2CB8D|nr:protein phosphatase 2C domain-containing protein [Actinocorallia sp. A-T 12471]MDX6742550.1 protein phosphatase 2C domain-containing protein [Actinocorallia sp. A-T 12471]
MNVAIRYAAGSDIGCNRENNEDSGYAGLFLLAVADGMGGYAGGEVASSTVINALARFDAPVPETELQGTLARAVSEVNGALGQAIAAHPELNRMGTTLTAMLWNGTSRFALAHIGDSRAYLLRDGVLFQITSDHTLAQLLADGGDAGENSHLSHMLFKVLDGGPDREPDLATRDAQVGDRYLLCSDGLSGPVGPQEIFDILSEEKELPRAVSRLIAAARDHGGPDNITCVVLDVVEPEPLPENQRPTIVGAVAGA